MAQDDAFGLSEAEQKWLDQKHTVRVRVGNWPPFLFSEGGFRGISVDYIEKIFSLHGIRYEFISDSQVPWKEALEDIKKHQVIDLILTAKITDERKESMVFTDEYLFLPWVIFSRTDSAFIAGMQDLAGKTVCVPDGYVMHDLLVKNYPEINLMLMSGGNVEPRCIGALAKGVVDAYVGNLAVGSYVIQQEGYTNLKVAAPTPFGPHNQAMAVRDDWPELASIINKTLRSFTPAEHAEIRNKWLSIRYEYGISAADILEWILGITGFAAIIISIIFFWNRRLQKEIIHRRQVEKILNQFKFTLDQTRDCIFMFTPDSLKFIYTNQGATDHVGYSKEQFLHMTPVDIKPEFTEEAFRKMLAPLLAGTQESLLFETVHEHKNNARIPVEIFLQFVKQPTEESGRFMAIVRDISERKKAQEQIRLAHHQLQTVMNSINAMIYVADLETYEILLINKYVRTHFGEITGKRCWEAIQDGQDGPCAFCGLDTDAPSHRVWQVLNTRNGEWYECHDEAIEWVDGRKVLLQVATNISERKKYEQEREKLIVELQNAIAEIKDLRGILPICSYCKNIRNDEGYYEQIESYIHKHSGVDFSHTICPSCLEKYYPAGYEMVAKKKPKS